MGAGASTRQPQPWRIAGLGPKLGKAGASRLAKGYGGEDVLDARDAEEYLALVAGCGAWSALARLAPSREAAVEIGALDAALADAAGPSVGEVVAYDRVLLVGSADATVIGSPYVRDAVVEVRVEEQALADKVIVFKKKRRKGYRRWKGYRARLTVLRVSSITCPELDALERGDEPPGAEVGGQTFRESGRVIRSARGSVEGPPGRATNA